MFVILCVLTIIPQLCKPGCVSYFSTVTMTVIYGAVYPDSITVMGLTRLRGQHCQGDHLRSQFVSITSFFSVLWWYMPETDVWHISEAAMGYDDCDHFVVAVCHWDYSSFLYSTSDRKDSWFRFLKINESLPLYWWVFWN